MAVLLIGAMPGLAEPVKVRAAAHDGYGRIVFNWQSPVVFSAISEGGLLVVNFGRPIEASYATVVRGLRGYLRDATPGADGRSVTFTLRGPFDVRSFDMGSAVVVDIIKAVDPAAVAAVPDPAANGPQVRVRTGIHKGYTRVVFDWPEKVDYEIIRKGGTVELSFRRPATINLSPLQGRTPKFIGGASQRHTSDGVTVLLQVLETSRIKDFRAGSKVVVDVFAPSPEQLAAKTEAEPPTPTEKTAAEPPTPAKPEPPQAAAQPKALTPTRLTAPTPLSPTGGGEKSGLFDDEDEAALASLAGVKIVDPTAAGATGGPVAVGQQDGGDGGDAVGIRIDWDEPVAAAVFRRAGYLWVVFDKPAQIDIEGLRAAAGNIVRSIEQVPHDRATLLRMTTLAGINPSLRRDGLAWILDFRQQSLEPATAIEINPQPRSPIGARLFLSVTEPGGGIVVRDPAVGDNLVVVPVIPLGYGVAAARDYPQVRILPSIQGIVLQPKSDDLRVRSLRQGVEVTSASGLKLSDIPADVAADSKLGGNAAMRTFTRLFDLGKWRQTSMETFNETKQELQRLAAEASTEERQQARLDLARFYFANNYGHYTLCAGAWNSPAGEQVIALQHLPPLVWGPTLQLWRI